MRHPGGFHNSFEPIGTLDAARRVSSRPRDQSSSEVNEVAGCQTGQCLAAQVRKNATATAAALFPASWR
jgi:hypothetical protein